MVSPSASRPSTWSANASAAISAASSYVAAAVTAPGKSGNETPKSEPLSLCTIPMYRRIASPQFQAGLLLDALERANRNVGIGMRHRHQASGLMQMSELHVAASLSDLDPAHPFQCRDYLPAAHEASPIVCIIYTKWRPMPADLPCAWTPGEHDQGEELPVISGDRESVGATSNSALAPVRPER